MRQILLFAGLVASLALLVGCGAVKGEPNTAEDVPDKAAYHKISADDVLTGGRGGGRPHPGGIRRRAY